jgi:hypothetical protein
VELVVGGLLDAGSDRGPVVAYDGASWRALGSPPDGTCTALGLFGGELIAAISRSPISSAIVAWNGTAWRTLGAMTGIARTMTLFNGRLVLGGSFSHVDGLPAANVIQWNGSAWSALGVNAGGVSGDVYALAVFSGLLWVGGDITHASGIPVGNLATWSGASWSAAASCNGGVRALAVRAGQSIADSFLFAGGFFTAVGVTAAQSVARFNAQNGWLAMGPGVPPCSALLVRSTGTFTFEVVAGVAASSLPVRSWNGSTWDVLGGAGGQAIPNALAVFAGRYVYAGSSTISSSVRTLHSGGIWQPLSGLGLDGPVVAVLATANDLVIGGSFTFASRLQVNGIARGTIGAWQPLGSGVLDGRVNALATMPNGDIVAAGTFTSAGGSAANLIARWNGSTWSPLGGLLGSAILALAVLPNGRLVAAGSITQAGAQPVQNIVQWDGTAWSAMGSGLDGIVSTLAVRPNGELLAGGVFQNSGTAPMRFLARWNGSAWSAMPGEPDAQVTELAVLGSGDVLVGGLFNAVGSLPSIYLARWNGSSWTAVPGLVAAPFSYRVHTIVPLPRGHALVSGERRSGNNPQLLRYDGQGLIPLPDPSAYFVDGVRSSNGDAVFVGDFLRAAGVLSAYVTRYVSPCPAIADVYGVGCSGSGGVNTMRATQLPWIGTAFAAEATGMPAQGLVVALTGFTSLSIPLQNLLQQGVPGCHLLASPDISVLGVPRNGLWQSVLPIPASTALVGLVLHHQCLALELDAGSNIVAVTGTNGLRLTIGVF